MNYPTIDQFVGSTPLVRLQRLPGNTTNTILAKLEGNNPAGSVKDRPALSMISEAEAKGAISPGDVLIEATSGNTGIALAMVAAIKGYEEYKPAPEKEVAEKIAPFNDDLKQAFNKAGDIGLQNELAGILQWLNQDKEEVSKLVDYTKAMFEQMNKLRSATEEA